ncbi:MAG: pyridoxine 5'-phosphate synthase [Pseudomonadota bacterium]
MASHLRLGVNIDHVATIRNARGGAFPDPARAAELAQTAGADGITIHLREDRRHIRDDDLTRIKSATDLPINLEMAVTDEMLVIGERFKPHAACFVPEKREERTTEGGLNVAGLHNQVAPAVARMRDVGSRVSVFIEPDPVQIAVAEVLQAPVVELHTGKYAELWLAQDEAGLEAELNKLRIAAQEAAKRGIEPHAGHGLTYDNVGPIAAIPELAELNIGHFLVGEAVFVGLEASIARMRQLMDDARK